MCTKRSCMNNTEINQYEDVENLQDSIDIYDSCECGFSDYDGMFPTNPTFGQAYVPIQYMDKTFKPAIGLEMGTIFPELVSPYTPCQSMEEIEYLRTINPKGVCNK